MKKISIAIVSLILGFGIFSSSVQAAGQCKGMAKTACAESLDCGWVKGYTRKDDVEVKGHCRANKGAAKEKAKAKKLAAKKKRAAAKAKKKAAKQKAKSEE